jgi:adenylosuccinate synthase
MRRCGWIDLVALRYAVRVNGMTHLAITKLDVLDSFDELKLCTAYQVGDRQIREFPADEAALASVQPVYESMAGWQSSTTEARKWTDLPSQATAYISRIEDYVRVPVALVSIGADRLATFSRLAIWEGL